MARGEHVVINSNFSAGELDPRLVPMRSDVQAWQQGCKQMVNMRPLLHGGATTRPGTNYVSVLAGEAALVPFEFSETQGYILCFRDAQVDIFFDDGTYATGVPTDISVARAKVMGYAQAGDTMILCHQDLESRVLRRTGVASFSIAPFAFSYVPNVGMQQPYIRLAPPQVYVTPTAAGGSGIVSVTIGTSSPWFTSAHVGSFMRIGATHVYITAILDPLNFVGDVHGTIASGTASTHDWDEQAFSAANGWPRAVCFHNERLVFGGSRAKPSGIWASQIGDFSNFDLADSTDDKAIWSAIAADKVVTVLHLASFKHLSIFTDQVELYQPESDNQPWSPKTTAFKAQSGFGCSANVRPARFDDSVVFLQKYGHQLREFLYNNVSESYSSDALSVMNPGILKAPVSMTAITASKDIDEQYAYVVQADGSISVLHSLRAQRITAWARWQTTGPSQSYVQVCAVSGRVFVLARRTVAAGEVRYYLELIDHSHALDSAIRVPVSVGGVSASGLGHLEGLRAQAVNNGYAYEPDQISGGVYAITDDAWAHPSALIGLPFGTLLESMPPEIGTASKSSSRNRNLRIVKASVQVHESIRMVVEGEGMVITNIDDDYSAPPNPQSGMYDFVLLGFSRGRTVVVQCDVPLPLTILGLALECVL